VRQIRSIKGAIMKKFIFILCLVTACGNTDFFEDFETAPTDIYRVYPKNSHTDEIVQLDTKVYKMTGNAAYQFCNRDIKHISFDLMVPNFASVAYVFLTDYDIRIRQDGSVVGDIFLDSLLAGVWHHIDIKIYPDANKIEFDLDRNTTTFIQTKSKVKTNCLLFVLPNSAEVYIDNIHIF
jgi:hypothetical protein